ncbi:MAG: hypothetical protein J0H09_21515, partial [Burkholderiales bacterium]|nr:hypothetical protein [Burkholderiales bacterium]
KARQPIRRLWLQSMTPAAIGWHPLDIDGIIARSGAGAAEVAARLVELELSGLVERRSDGRFVRRRTESP